RRHPHGRRSRPAAAGQARPRARGADRHRTQRRVPVRAGQGRQAGGRRARREQAGSGRLPGARRARGAMTGHRVTTAELTAAPVTEILALVRTATLTDGVAPLSEHVMLHLRYDAPGIGGARRQSAAGAGPAAADRPGAGRDFVVSADGEIAGYAYLDPPPADGEV